MTTQPARKGNSKPIKQGSAANLLGVTREHLNRVLNGKRESRRLIKAYRKLVGGSR